MEILSGILGTCFAFLAVVGSTSCIAWMDPTYTLPEILDFLALLQLPWIGPQIIRVLCPFIGQLFTEAFARLWLFFSIQEILIRSIFDFVRANSSTFYRENQTSDSRGSPSMHMNCTHQLWRYQDLVHNDDDYFKWLKYFPVFRSSYSLTLVAEDSPALIKRGKSSTRASRRKQQHRSQHNWRKFESHLGTWQVFRTVSIVRKQSADTGISKLWRDGPPCATHAVWHTDAHPHGTHEMF